MKQFYCWYSQKQASQPYYNPETNKYENYSKVGIYRNIFGEELKCTYITTYYTHHDTMFKDIKFIGEVVDLVREEKHNINK